MSYQVQKTLEFYGSGYPDLSSWKDVGEPANSLEVGNARLANFQLGYPDYTYRLVKICDISKQTIMPEEDFVEITKKHLEENS